MQPKKFEEQVFFSTVRITITGKSGAGASIGTGFLFRAPLGDTRKRNVILLISNKHVYGHPNQNVILNFHRGDPDDPTRPLLGEIQTVEADEFSSVYSEHPDSDVDLACLNVSVITHSKQPVFSKCLRPDMLATFEEPALLPGKAVWFVGYPVNRFDQRHNLPILRTGHIASLPKIDFNGRKEFLIDAQVFPGSSGSPVFALLGKKYQLVGVVTRTMIRHQQLQAIPAGLAPGVEQVLGLGVILKAPLLTELIDSATADIREKLAKQEPEPVSEPPTESH